MTKTFRQSKNQSSPDSFSKLHKAPLRPATEYKGTVAKRLRTVLRPVKFNLTVEHRHF